MWKSALSLFSWTNNGSAPALIDYFALTLDMNTAMLMYLNVYYSTSYKDLARPLQRFLAEATAKDITLQWQKLRRRARGDAS